MKYIKQTMIILGVTLVGEWIRYVIPLPIPGSIYGLLLLFLLLMTGIVKLEQIKAVSDFLLAIMPVLFIPAAAGLMDVVPLLKEILIPMIIAVLPITVLVMGVSGKVTDKIMEAEEKKNGQ